MERNRRVGVSKYMSYLLRHNPEDLKMDSHGFVDIDALLEKLGRRFSIDKECIFEIVDRSKRKRFEIVGKKIRALYGHTIPVQLELAEDQAVQVLYHGTTPEAASRILAEGLKPMRRRRVHLSPTIEIATHVGTRRTQRPVILKIDVERAREQGVRFYKATEQVYVCDTLPPRYIEIAT